jgi:hypothetical protein
LTFKVSEGIAHQSVEMMEASETAESSESLETCRLGVGVRGGGAAVVQLQSFSCSSGRERNEKNLYKKYDVCD